MPWMYPNADVRTIVEILVGQIASTLEDNLEALYLRGALALGDFNPETSDIDLLVLTRELVTDKDFTALTRMHGQIEKMPNRYASDIELAYAPLDAIQNF